jgi:hypothetical protein
MAVFAPSDVKPLVILTGSPEEADRFLTSALWRDTGMFVSVPGVLGWADVLRERGSDFASHAAACHYWLHEHTENVPAVLQAWRRERNARDATARAIVTLGQQRTLVDRLVMQGADTAAAAKAILELMQQTFRVICDIWETHVKALDALLLSGAPRHRDLIDVKRPCPTHETMPRATASLTDRSAA